MQFHHKLYSSMVPLNNFLPPIPVSGWLIFCCRNLILHQKKEEEEAKMFTKTKNMPKKYM